MKPSGPLSSHLLVLSALATLGACQGRSNQELVVNKDAAAPVTATSTGSTTVPDKPTTSPPAAAAAANGSLSAADMAKGKIYVNGWDGKTDQIPAGSVWTLSKATAVAANPPGPPSPPPPSAGGGAAAGGAAAGAGGGGGGGAPPTLDPRVQTIVSGTCAISGCHDGSKPPSMASAADISSAKASIQNKYSDSPTGQPMPPSGANFTPEDKAAIAAWTSGGGGAAAGGAAGGGATLTIVDDATRKSKVYLNDTPVTVASGGTLHIVNSRTQGTFIIHSNGVAAGDPFEHGDVANPVPPGGSIDIQVQGKFDSSPDASGAPKSQDIYEHTDGSVNSDRIINLIVN